MAVLACLLFLAAHGTGLGSPYVVNDDTRQQVFWMQRFADPALYPNDPLSDYAALYVPQAVQALYRAAAPFVNALAFSKLLTGALFVLLSVAFFGLGAGLGGRELGYGLAAVTWLMPTFLYNMSGGISRTFAAPLTVLLLWRFVRRDALGTGLTLLALAVFIPYAFILGAAACGIGWLAGRLRPGLAPPFPARLAHFAVLAAGGASIWLMSRAFDAAGYGPLAAIADMAGRPEFTAQGRLELYPQPGLFMDAVYYPFERVGLFLEFGLVWGIVSLVVLAAVIWRYAPRVPWRRYLERAQGLYWLALAAVGLYIAARLVLLKLFVPDRYLAIPENILIAVGLAAVGLEVARPWLAGRRRAAAVLALVAVVACLRLHGQGLFDYAAHAATYAAVRELPKDALLAGHPWLMDDVMTFGQRKAVANYKLAHVWSLGWWRAFEPRLRDELTAYYAKDPETVRAFARKYGVTALVVDEADFSPAFLANRPFFAPYDALIRELAGRPGDFVLLNDRLFPCARPQPGLRLIDLR